MTDQRVTIRDVARACGFSIATVSRALSRPALVAPDTRDAVLRAAQQIGYRPNRMAQNLRRRRAGGVLALVPNLANPFFSDILSGIAAVLGPAGYSLMVTDTAGEGAAGALDLIEPSRADGVIVLDGSIPAPALQGRLPAVQVCEWVVDLAAPRVRIDNAAAARLAVGHLLALGHRRIGHVCGPRGNVLTEARLRGVRAELATQGVPLAASALYTGDFGLESGRLAAGHWLAQPAAQRPSAVFLQSDAMAVSFIGELARHGVRVPADVSVVGFDDIELSGHLVPPLTTIHQPRKMLGRAAAERLIALMLGARGEGPEDAGGQAAAGPSAGADTALPVNLVVRESTAPCMAA